MPTHPPIVLALAASDPSGGAGLQADILTLACLGCHPASVVTAVTVQDTLGVAALHPLPARWVVEQARAVLTDMPVAAVKIGVVGSAGVARGIAEVLADHPRLPIVLDPVLASGRGDELAGEDAVAALRALLLPKATLVTPNVMEARRLAAEGGAPEPSAARCAAKLIAAGCGHVLVTGTHAATPEVVNTLYGPGGVIRSDSWRRLPGSYHGSGCTLASAIAAFLARGRGIAEAVREGQQYTWQTLARAFRPGRGQFIPDRLFWTRAHAEAAD